MDTEKRKASSVGHWIKGTRERMGWSQEELAEKVGVSPKSIGRWERGETEPKEYARRKLFTVFCEVLEDVDPIPTSHDVSVRVQNKGYLVGSITNQGKVNIVGSEVGTVSVDSRQMVTGTNPNLPRGQMLLRLESNYRDELAKSFDGMVRMEPSLTSLPETLWKNTPTVPPGDFLAERFASNETSIIQMYETGRRELLIVGEAGAGKSTLLFVLGQYLVDKAMED